MDWFKNEDFWRELYPFMFSEQRFASARQEMDEVLALAGCPPCAALDLCCGPGRHSVELASRGFTVTGVDGSPFLLGKARAADERVEWVLEDMRRFRRPGAFSLAFSLFTSFGYFDDDADNRRVLGNLFESLAPGGVLVMEMLGKEVLARMLETARVTEVGEALLVQRPRVVDSWSRVCNEWHWIRDGVVRRFEFTHWVYSGTELRDRLAGAGFTDIHLHGDLAGADYDSNARRLVAVARKTA